VGIYTFHDLDSTDTTTDFLPSVLKSIGCILLN